MHAKGERFVRSGERFVMVFFGGAGYDELIESASEWGKRGLACGTLSCGTATQNYGLSGDESAAVRASIQAAVAKGESV